MDEDLIEDLADAFAAQLNLVCSDESLHPEYRFAMYDAIMTVANIINVHQPTYDLRYFYRRAGYPEPYPIHEMQG